MLVEGKGSNAINGPVFVEILDGYLYVVNRGDQSSPHVSPNVVQIDPNSGAITNVYANSSPPPYSDLNGVLVVPNGADKYGGNLYVADQKGNWADAEHGTVDEIQPATLTEMATIGPAATNYEVALSDGTYPLDADYFTNIQDMKVDARGNLIVLDGGDSTNYTLGSIVNVSYDPSTASWNQTLISPHTTSADQLYDSDGLAMCVDWTLGTYGTAYVCSINNPGAGNLTSIIAINLDPGSSGGGETLIPLPQTSEDYLATTGDMTVFYRPSNQVNFVDFETGDFS
jgi:hypothetical protein